LGQVAPWVALADAGFRVRHG